MGKPKLSTKHTAKGAEREPPASTPMVDNPLFHNGQDQGSFSISFDTTPEETAVDAIASGIDHANNSQHPHPGHPHQSPQHPRKKKKKDRPVKRALTEAELTERRFRVCWAIAVVLVLAQLYTTVRLFQSITMLPACCASDPKDVLYEDPVIEGCSFYIDWAEFTEEGYEGKDIPDQASMMCLPMIVLVLEVANIFGCCRRQKDNRHCIICLSVTFTVGVLLYYVVNFQPHQDLLVDNIMWCHDGSTGCDYPPEVEYAVFSEYSDFGRSGEPKVVNSCNVVLANLTSTPGMCDVGGPSLVSCAYFPPRTDRAGTLTYPVGRFRRDLQTQVDNMGTFYRQALYIDSVFDVFEIVVALNGI